MPKQEEIKYHRNPSVATDIIIEYEQDGVVGIVLIERKNPPYGLALPGGFHEYGLSAVDNARKEAMEETGLEILVRDPPSHPFMVSTNPNRDPRGHIISLTYVAQGSGELCAGDDAAAARVYSYDEVVDLIHRDGLAFDHADILTKYLQTKGAIR